MPDREPKIELLELPGKQIIRHLVDCIERNDPSMMAENLNHLQNLLEESRKSKAGTVTVIQANQFIKEATGGTEVSYGELDFASGTSGDRFYFHYEKDKRRGSIWVKYDHKADPTRTSLYNLGRIFGYESCGHPDIWDYGDTRGGIRVNFQLHDSVVEIIPLEQ